MRYMPLSQYKSLCRKNAQAPGVLVQKRMASVIEPIGDRRVRYTISTAAIDRDNDSVNQDGWDLRSYMQNPVVLWGHNHSALPIGRAAEIALDGGALKSVVEFVPADMPVVGELAEAVLRMCRTGFLNATSVGFRILEAEIAKDRDDESSWFPPLNYMHQELMEFSVVSIPANPEALIDPSERQASPVPEALPVHLDEATLDRVRAQVRDDIKADLAAQAEAKRLADIATRRKHRQREAMRVGFGLY